MHGELAGTGQRYDLQGGVSHGGRAALMLAWTFS